MTDKIGMLMLFLMFICSMVVIKYQFNDIVRLEAQVSFCERNLKL